MKGYLAPYGGSGDETNNWKNLNVQSTAFKHLVMEISMKREVSKLQSDSEFSGLGRLGYSFIH